MRSIRELVGRTDLLRHLDYLTESEREEFEPNARRELGRELGFERESSFKDKQ
jgi:hypothetical protein